MSDDLADLPAPLVPADIDISGLDGFMLDVQRLFASELWALSTGDEFKAAMGLWGRAWQQTPPGSLPDDERTLAAFSGAAKGWKKVRAMALRGFVKCSNGRLYHRVLCEDVTDGRQKEERLPRRSRGRARTPEALEGHKKKKGETRFTDVSDDVSTPISDDVSEQFRDGLETGDETSTKRLVQGQGQGQGQKERELSPARSQPLPAGRDQEFDRIETICRRALGDAAPLDPVIGPMISLIRKGFPEQAIIDELTSQARRPRQRPIRTWKIWAQIVEENLTDRAESGRGPTSRGPPDRPYQTNGWLQAAIESQADADEKRTDQFESNHPET